MNRRRALAALSTTVTVLSAGCFSTDDERTSIDGTPERNTVTNTAASETHRVTQETQTEATETEQGAEVREDFLYENNSAQDIELTLEAFVHESDDELVQKTYQIAESAVEKDTLEELRDELVRCEFTTASGLSAEKVWGPDKSSQLRLTIAMEEIRMRVVS